MTKEQYEELMNVLITLRTSAVISELPYYVMQSEKAINILKETQTEE